jgi:hypothetical protein
MSISGNSRTYKSNQNRTQGNRNPLSRVKKTPQKNLQVVDLDKALSTISERTNESENSQESQLTLQATNKPLVKKESLKNLIDMLQTKFFKDIPEIKKSLGKRNIKKGLEEFIKETTGVLEKAQEDTVSISVIKNLKSFKNLYKNIKDPLVGSFIQLLEKSFQEDPDKVFDKNDILRQQI